jgi:acetyltransferase-like isoleucine patch superfamily enzyme
MLLKKIASRILPLATIWYEDLQEWDSRKRCVCGVDTKLYLSCSINNGGHPAHCITIGANTHIRGELILYPSGKSIKVGDSCYIGDHTRIWCMASIVIGNRVLISHGVNIHDNISHSLSAGDRHRHFAEILTNGHQRILTNVTSMPIVIGDDVWIGFNATILKGVTIGRGAIVGACAVVTKDVSAYTVVVGNPATVVGNSTP